MLLTGYGNFLSGQSGVTNSIDSFAASVSRGTWSFRHTSHATRMRNWQRTFCSISLTMTSLLNRSFRGLKRNQTRLGPGFYDELMAPDSCGRCQVKMRLGTAFDRISAFELVAFSCQLVRYGLVVCKYPLWHRRERFSSERLARQTGHGMAM